MTVDERVLRLIDRLARRNRQTPLSGELSLRDDLGFDSMRLIGLVMSLEEEFGRTIPDTALATLRITTVGDVVHAATALLGAR